MTVKLVKVVGPLKIEVPCIDNFGSCTYNDVCSMLPSPGECPPFFVQQGIPCDCPFPSGIYEAKSVDLEVDLPTKIPSGEYTILADLKNKQLGHVGCILIDLNVK